MITLGQYLTKGFEYAYSNLQDLCRYAPAASESVLRKYPPTSLVSNILTVYFTADLPSRFAFCLENEAHIFTCCDALPFSFLLP